MHHQFVKAFSKMNTRIQKEAKEHSVPAFKKTATFLCRPFVSVSKVLGKSTVSFKLVQTHSENKQSELVHGCS